MDAVVNLIISHPFVASYKVTDTLRVERPTSKWVSVMPFSLLVWTTSLIKSVMVKSARISFEFDKQCMDRVAWHVGDLVLDQPVHKWLASPFHRFLVRFSTVL